MRAHMRSWRAVRPTASQGCKPFPNHRILGMAGRLQPARVPTVVRRRGAHEPPGHERFVHPNPY